MTQELQTLIDELLAESRGERVDDISAMAEIVDIPLAKATSGPRCEYAMASGEACGRAVEGAAAGEPVYCQAHADWLRLGIASWGVPFPEDATSLQQFLTAVMDRMLSGRVRMGLEKPVADVCRLIAQNVRGVEMERRRR